jgi:hypothetical protein
LFGGLVWLLVLAQDVDLATAQKGTVPFKHVVIDAEPPKQPYYKLAGDFDRDGDLDLAVAGRNGPMLIYSYPGWAKTKIADGGWNGVNGETADIDRDGDVDIVMGGVVWFSNPGRGGGSWELHRIDEQRGHDIEVADLNGDGRLDVVSRDQSAFGRSGDQIHVYYQADSPAWRKQTLPCPHGEGLKLSDLDRDGDADVIIGGLWYENRSDDWLRHSYSAAWTEPDAKAETADVNGDGRLDIVLVPAELRRETYRVAWYEAPEKTTTDNWAEHIIAESIECVIHSLGTGDLDRDGDVDIAIAEMHQGEDPDEVSVFLNSERGTVWKKQVLSNTGSHDIVVADFGNDGDLDIVGANHAEVHPLELWENQLAQSGTPPKASSSGKPSLDSWRRHVIDPQRPERAVYVVAGDLNGDGLPDIASGPFWYQNPGRNDGPWRRTAIGEPLHNLAVLADLDRDGDLDVVGTQGRGSRPSHDFVWAQSDGAGSFQIHANIESLGSGDFLQGVDVFRAGTGEMGLVLSWHNGGGGIFTLNVPTRPDSGRWTCRQVSEQTLKQDVEAGDIDRDGDVDFLLGTAWLRNDGSTWSWQTLFETGDKPDRVRLVDMNSDGRLDAVVGYIAISKPGKLAWYEQPREPSRQWSEHLVSATLVGPMSLDAADADGDGDLDLAVGEHNLVDPAAAKLYVLENSDGAGDHWTSRFVHQGDEHHDGAQLVDIDRDGDLDIISIGWGHGKVLLYENASAGRSP